MTRTDHLMEKLAIAFPQGLGKRLHEWMKKKKEGADNPGNPGVAPSQPSNQQTPVGPGANQQGAPDSNPSSGSSSGAGKQDGSAPSPVKPSRPGRWKPGSGLTPLQGSGSRPKCPGWLRNKIKKGDVTKAQANKMLKQGNYSLIEKIAAGKVGKPSPSSPTTKPKPRKKPWAHAIGLPNKPSASKC